MARPGGDEGAAQTAQSFLTDRHVDGVLLLSLHADDPLPELLEARGVPTVCGGSPATTRPRTVVDADNLGGGRSAVQHLVATGRRRLAVLAGPQDMSSGRDRLAGALDAAAEAGHPATPWRWPTVTTRRRAGVAPWPRCWRPGRPPTGCSRPPT